MTKDQWFGLREGDRESLGALIMMIGTESLIVMHDETTLCQIFVD